MVKATEKKDVKAKPKRKVTPKKEEKLETISLDKQNKLKGISKAVSVLAKIGAILMVIVAVCMLICALALPFISKNIKITDGLIEAYGEKYEYFEDIEGFKVVHNGEVLKIVEASDVTNFRLVSDFIKNNDVNKLMWGIEFIFIMTLVISVLAFITLRNIGRLFANIYIDKTPFTTKNVELLRSIGYLSQFLFLNAS